ncbi:MAG: hypothetical protein ACRDB9_07675 [Cetobacterium sp.]
MRNTLGDLNNHLFAQLERLSDEEVKGEALEEEIERAKAVTHVAQRIIDNGALVLKAKEVASSKFNYVDEVPKMLEG